MKQMFSKSKGEDNILCQLFDYAGDAILFFEISDNHFSNFLQINQSACDLLGYTKEEMFQLGPYDIFTLSPQEMRNFFSIDRNKPILLKTSLIKKDGSYIFVEMNSRIIFVEQRWIALSIVRDLTLARFGKNVPQDAEYYDSVTALPNRNYVTKFLFQEIEAAHQNNSFSVYILNIDQFKMINDGFGFSFGDALLKIVANRIYNICQPLGLVAHFGGDEFFIFCNQTQQDDTILERILAEVRNPIYINHEEFYITASIGVSHYPIHGENADVLLKNASLALQYAKEKGGNQFKEYHPNFEKKIRGTLSLKNDLHKAIADNELVLYYQPRIHFKTNRINGAEALLRWNHPQKGMISPATFIPIAEKSAMIIDIGNWVIKSVCKQIQEWKNRLKQKMRISINLSGRQLEWPDMIPFLTDTLQQYDVEGDWLEFEITESMLMSNRDEIVEKLDEIKRLGIKVTIDDFGKGYSSLQRISKLPVDCIKIDKTFTQEIQDIANAYLVSTIISLGKNLKLDIVAEGVETEEQLHFFQNTDCNEWQGYLFSAPVPVNQFERILYSSSLLKV